MGPRYTGNRRSCFHSVSDLITAIQAYFDAHNNEPKPFIWTATAEDILTKVAQDASPYKQSIKTETHH